MSYLMINSWIVYGSYFINLLMKTKNYCIVFIFYNLLELKTPFSLQINSS